MATRYTRETGKPAARKFHCPTCGGDGHVAAWERGCEFSPDPADHYDVECPDCEGGVIECEPRDDLRPWSPPNDSFYRRHRRAGLQNIPDALVMLEKRRREAIEASRKYPGKVVEWRAREVYERALGYATTKARLPA